MNSPLWIVMFALAASACAQRLTTTIPSNLSAQIAVAERDLELLKLSYTAAHPTILLAERELWQLESQLEPEARSAALQARIDAERLHLDSLTSRAESDEDSAVRTSRNKIRYLEELLAGSANEQRFRRQDESNLVNM